MHSTQGSQGVKETPFPLILDGMIGDVVVQTVNARDLHAFLGVGKDFSNWIKDRIAAYSFNENSDFVCSPILASEGRGGHNRLDYHLTLDMAKEMAMVERNAKGREARRYFIACERMLRERVQREADIEALVERKVKAAIADTHLIARSGMTAGEILRAAGFPPMIGLAPWFGNLMNKLGFAMAGGAKAQLGGRTARLFDPDKVNLWLRTGGRSTVDLKIATRRGQKVIHLVPPVSEAARTY